MNETFEDRAKREKTPLPFKVYKGVKGKFGAMRLNFKRPYTNDNNAKKQEGVLFLEAAPPTGAGSYDWENKKIIFAMGLVDAEM